MFEKLLLISVVGMNPPKSSLKRGTKIRILAPFLRGFGGFTPTTLFRHPLIALPILNVYNAALIIN
jgi:hypothetical protein